MFSDFSCQIPGSSAYLKASAFLPIAILACSIEVCVALYFISFSEGFGWRSVSLLTNYNFRLSKEEFLTTLLKLAVKLSN